VHEQQAAELNTTNSSTFRIADIGVDPNHELTSDGGDF